jgi:hypothetical protein
LPRHTIKRGKNALISRSLLRWRGFATAAAIKLMVGFALLGAPAHGVAERPGRRCSQAGWQDQRRIVASREAVAVQGTLA